MQTVGSAFELVVEGAPGALGDAVERRDAVTGAQTGQPLARAFRDGGGVEIGGLDAGAREDVSLALAFVGRRRVAGARREREGDRAGLEDGEITETAPALAGARGDGGR